MASSYEGAVTKDDFDSAPFAGFPREGVPWFRRLALEQSRDWFQENRAAYEELWVRPMSALLGELARPLCKVYGRAVGPPKIFRLNRDLRFSKDKRPYKTNIAGLLPLSRAASMESPAALYLHLGLEETVAFGFYVLQPPALRRLRELVLHEAKGPALQRLVNAAAAKGLELDGLERLKRAPAGVLPTHPRIELLKQKGLALSRPDIPKDVRFKATLKGWLLEQAKAAAPLVKWGLAQDLG
jgi:uncharacterized protein (TIGR02453 family)